MALDGTTLHHLVNELGHQLSGARIDRVTQPEKEEIHLLLRNQGQSFRLLLNVSATASRIHLTNESKKNPPAPPMFCMILRKHLEGGKILALKQKGLERVLTLSVQNYNEYGDLATYHLILEIMGKHSNLILVDPETGVILDGLKRYSHALSRHREVLPGRIYIAPPPQGKVDPLSSEEKWREVLFQDSLTKKVRDLLLRYYAGISPELAREIVTRAGLDLDITLDQCGDIDLSRLFQAYSVLANPEHTPTLQPTIFFQGAKGINKGLEQPLTFTFLLFQQYQGLPFISCSSLNEAIEKFYSLKANINSCEAKRGSLRKVIKDHLNHLAKKKNIYEDSIATASKNLKYQRWGELLTANLYRLEKGMKEITVEDYNEEDLPQITIPLEPHLKGIENAQRYYRLYNKAKATIKKTTPLKEALEEEVEYLLSVLLSLEQASTLAELDEVHKELIQEDYISGKQKEVSKGLKKKLLKKAKHKGQKKKPQTKQKPEVPKPRVYYSSQNRLILVGKNNRQNDWLTLRRGRPHDLWLHTKNIPGSHVLIPLNEGEEFPDDATLEEAAALAIYYSQAKDSTQVPVDYTHVKNIRKPKGAKPGMVIYDTYYTLYLTPKEEVLERLLATEGDLT
ncbi:MAG: fibronectin/fibrinogen-binding protein [Desulfitobacterium sp.]|nr:fibronectin/fibrinogen-binding protein [Desulfitobacterium sp.]